MGSILSIDSRGRAAGALSEGRVKIHPSEGFERGATQTGKFFCEFRRAAKCRRIRHQASCGDGTAGTAVAAGRGSLPSLLRASSAGQHISWSTGGGKVWQLVEKYRLAGRLSRD
jgi:hypothetical protein